jgi:hypothetical protein
MDLDQLAHLEPTHLPSKSFALFDASRFTHLVWKQ